MSRQERAPLRIIAHNGAPEWGGGEIALADLLLTGDSVDAVIGRMPDKPLPESAIFSTETNIVTRRLIYVPVWQEVTGWSICNRLVRQEIN